jgi:hypothetical protein
MRKFSLILIVVYILILSGCVSVPPPFPNDPYIEGPKYIRVNEETIYRIKNIKSSINKEDVEWVLITVYNTSVYYDLGRGEECKVIITEEMMKKTPIGKFHLIASYTEGGKTREVGIYISVIPN